MFDKHTNSRSYTFKSFCIIIIIIMNGTNANGKKTINVSRETYDSLSKQARIECVIRFVPDASTKERFDKQGEQAVIDTTGRLRVYGMCGAIFHGKPMMGITPSNCGCSAGGDAIVPVLNGYRKHLASQTSK